MYDKSKDRISLIDWNSCQSRTFETRAKDLGLAARLIIRILVDFPDGTMPSPDRYVKQLPVEWRPIIKTLLRPSHFTEEFYTDMLSRLETLR
jgi:hypothetical protein